MSEYGDVFNDGPYHSRPLQRAIDALTEPMNALKELVKGYSVGCLRLLRVLKFCGICLNPEVIVTGILTSVPLFERRKGEVLLVRCRRMAQPRLSGLP